MTATEQQQAIVDAALGLLSTGGPQALRVRDIAEAAGCTTMTVYSRFGGKDGVVEAIYVDGFRRFAAALADASGSTGADEGLKMGLAYRAWALANPGSYQVMFTQAVPGFVPSDQASLIAMGSFQVLVDLVEELRVAGAIRDGDTTEMAWVIWGVSHGLVMLELAGIQPSTSAAVSEQTYLKAMQATMRGLRSD